MRPSKNMFGTQEEWQKAFVQWMNEDPSSANGKQFMMFGGSTPTAEALMFEGDVLDFIDCYFPVKNWDEVMTFASDNGYIIFIEDDDRWDDLQLMLIEAEDAEEETWYDANGVESLNGIYDAGGHMNAERLAEWDDDYRDRKRN